VHAAADLRKRHTVRLDAFDGGDAGPLARMDGGRLRCFRPWPTGDALGLAAVAADPGRWPWVAVLASHAGADGREVRALLAAGVKGLVVAATGNGSLAAPMAAALDEAARAGVLVCRASRCGSGPVLDPAPSHEGLFASGELSPWQARIDVLLALLAQA
jgi:L-asparaginase